MRFSSRPGFVFATSDLPGNHATMFGPARGKLVFRPDLSNFNDQERSYTWAFEWSQLVDGQRFVFATADRVVGAQVFGTELRALTFSDCSVVRDEEGKPLRLMPPAAPARTRADAVVPRVRVVARLGAGGGGPKVSVVTCSYNRPDLLRVAVESLRKQTDPDWEHLIYDDASSDKRVAEVLQWAALDPRVRVWRGDRNLDRPASLWNFLFDRARGRYLAVLDDDNEKLPDFVGAMSADLDADPELGIVTCGWIVQDDRDGEPDAPYHLNLSTCAPELNRISTCDGGAMLFRREVWEAVGYYAETLRTNEDWDWLRRAYHITTVKNRHECYSTYRSHRSNRMLRSADLGSDEDALTVRQRPLRSALGVRMARPAPGRLTRSQEEVCRGVQRALDALPWVVEAGDDLALVVSPFQMGDYEVRLAVDGCPRALSLHMEDPYALATNLERVRAMASICPEVWVSTCDVTTVEAYREVVGDRVVLCPALSADDVLPLPEAAARDVDVLLCGYAYPSRKRFVDKLLPKLGGLSVLLVGGGDGDDGTDGWRGYAKEGVQSLPAQGVEETRALHARAKTVVCAHRIPGDCGEGGPAPASVCRGFMEGALGPRVFLDKTRAHHHLDEGDAVFYDGPEDLSLALRSYLKRGRTEEARAFADKCRSLYTYRVRLARALNCVRAERRLAEIP